MAIRKDQVSKRASRQPADSAKRRNQSKRNRLAGWIKGNRTIALWVGGGILQIGAIITGTYWLLQNTPSDFTARLVNDSSVQLTYADEYSDKKSPACGCYYSPVDEWRGITFVANRAVLLPQTDAPHLNGYVISAAFPSEVKPFSSGFKIAPRYYQVELRPGEKFDPRSIEGLSPSSHDVKSRQAIPVGSTLSLYSDGPLHVETLGDVPVGAWIPALDGTVRVSRSRKTGNYRLVETFNHVPDENDAAAAERYAKSGSMWQVLDLIGPRLVVWTEGKSRAFASGGWTQELPQDPGGAARTLHVFVIDVPFALRVSVGALQAAEFPIEMLSGYTKDAASGMIAEPLVSGSVTAQLFSAQNNYDIIRARLEDEPIVDGCGISGFVGGGQICMEFRRPEPPAQNGISVYGRIQRMSFESVAGSMMLGSRRFEIDPPVPVNVLEASGFEHPLGGTAIPIQLSKDKLKVDGHFAARGEVTVNGEPVGTRIDRWAPFSGALALVLAIASVLMWIVAFYRGRPSKRKTVRK